MPIFAIKEIKEIILSEITHCVGSNRNQITSEKNSKMFLCDGIKTV